MRLLFFYFADNLAGAGGKEKQREKDGIKTLFFAAFFFSLLAISFARFSYAFEPFAFLS